ncbi:caspase family protein [Microvirga massiliensis]|uniref:caspase family protein n=1 Tax=Microvirga massiliensis TaxID=1033741 RepID=UPI000AE5A2F9|nr:caspase family protein [Microvirga massiliensis]
MTKRAVVVGINDYTGIDPFGDSDLHCCVPDAWSITDLLPSLGFDPSDIVTLTDAAATRDTVLLALGDVIRASQPGDVACFYFSGHGTVEPADPDDATCERFYESMCMATRPFLTDRDLVLIANQLEPSVVNFTVISDSCHSGGLSEEVDAFAKYKSLQMDSDLTERVQTYMNTWIPAGIAVPDNSDACRNNVSNVQVSEGGHLYCEEDPSQIFVPLAKMTLISGCRFWELSYESDGHGLLTKSILDTVNSSGFQMSYSDFMASIQAGVATDFESLLPFIKPEYPKSQTPQLRGQANRMDESFLEAWLESQ